MARAYYNDTNKAAVAVLRELIADGVIAPGDVDDRSIEDVQPDDLRGYTQCHFFAGGGLWSVAARLAGWPDERPLWTGSCPCQPFSVAGKGAGKDDPRHLWPHLLRLIRGTRTAGFGPPVLMGEQVSGKAGYGWFDGVRSDLAQEGFSCRTRDIPALAVDAPHERNRLYWLAVADAEGKPIGGGLREEQSKLDRDVAANRRRACPACGGRGRMGPFFPSGISTICGNCSLGDANPKGELESKGVIARRGGRDLHPDEGRLVHASRHGWREGRSEPSIHGGRSAVAGADAFGVDLVDTDHERRQELRGAEPIRAEQSRLERATGRNGSFWSDAEWILCHDGKARRTFSRVSGLAYGLPGMLAQLGNDSFVEAQAEIIAYAEATNTRPAEVLRAMREGVLSSSSKAPQEPDRRSGYGLGSAEGFCATQVLLHFLREYDRRADGGRSLLAVDKAARKPVRGMRFAGELAQPSCGREHLQQRPGKTANSLRELSHVLARHAEKAGAAVGASDAQGLGLLTPSFAGRVDLWSLAGNAISPILAAEVIAAFLDAEHEGSLP